MVSIEARFSIKWSRNFQKFQNENLVVGKLRCRTRNYGRLPTPPSSARMITILLFAERWQRAVLL